MRQAACASTAPPASGRGLKPLTQHRTHRVIGRLIGIKRHQRRERGARFHPLRQADRPIQKDRTALADLDAARWALHQPGTGIRQAADLLLRRLGVSDRVQANALPSNMILSLLRMGDHLAVVPRYVLRNASLAGELVKIDSGAATISLGHAAIWTSAKPPAAVTRFVAHMTAALVTLDDS